MTARQYEQALDDLVVLAHLDLEDNDTTVCGARVELRWHRLAEVTVPDQQRSAIVVGDPSLGSFVGARISDHRLCRRCLRGASLILGPEP